VILESEKEPSANQTKRQQRLYETMLQI